MENLQTYIDRKEPIITRQVIYKNRYALLLGIYKQIGKASLRVYPQAVNAKNLCQFKKILVPLDEVFILKNETNLPKSLFDQNNVITW